MRRAEVRAARAPPEYHVDVVSVYFRFLDLALDWEEPRSPNDAPPPFGPDCLDWLDCFGFLAFAFLFTMVRSINGRFWACTQPGRSRNTAGQNG